MLIRFRVHVVALALSALSSVLFAGHAAAADAYTFSVGETIPLVVDGTPCTYVITAGTGTVGTNGVDSTKNGFQLQLSLNNATADDYAFTWKGAQKGATATLSVTATAGDSYMRTATIVQRSTADWTKTQESALLLDSLPAGEFTVVVKILSVSGSSWGGNYGSFTMKSLSDYAFNLGAQTSAPFSATNAYAKVTGNASVQESGTALNATKNGDQIVLRLYLPEEARFKFGYKSALNATATFDWTLVGDSCNQAVTETIDNTTWDVFADHEHDFGVLNKGVYVLTGKTSRDGGGWTGNYKDFTFSFGNQKIISGVRTLTDDEDWRDCIATVEDGAIVDLAGFNLFVDRETTFAGAAQFTNSVATTRSQLTLESSPTAKLVWGGNLRVVVTGNGGSSSYFRNNSDLRPNTHMGGTVFSNLTADVRVYNFATNLSSGPVIFAGNGKVMVPSNDVFGDFQRIVNDIEISGTGNRMSFDRSGGTFTLSGSLTGDGDLEIGIGHNPNVALTGDLSEFAGTLSIAHSTGLNNYYAKLLPATETVGLPNGTLVMASTAANNKLQIHPSGTSYALGGLQTEGSAATNAWVYGSGLLKVGSVSGGVFGGSFRDNGSALSVEKVGDTAWTLTGTNHNFTGTFTVSAGTVVFANIEPTAVGSKIVVGADAAVSGSGTVTSPVEFAQGSVTVAAAASDVLKFASAVDATTMNVRLTGTLEADAEYPILMASSDSSGKAVSVVTDATWRNGSWKTRWVVNDDGTKTLKAYFSKIGFFLIFR